jgi:hypothetical protein
VTPALAIGLNKGAGEAPRRELVSRAAAEPKAPTVAGSRRGASPAPLPIRPSKAPGNG